MVNGVLLHDSIFTPGLICGISVGGLICEKTALQKYWFFLVFILQVLSCIILDCRISLRAYALPEIRSGVPEAVLFRQTCVSKFRFFYTASIYPYRNLSSFSKDLDALDSCFLESGFIWDFLLCSRSRNSRQGSLESSCPVQYECCLFLWLFSFLYFKAGQLFRFGVFPGNLSGVSYLQCLFFPCLSACERFLI